MKLLQSFWHGLVATSPGRSGLLIFVIALAVRLAFLFAFHTYRDLSRVELEKTAISLVKTGVYGNPYAIPTGPTAHVAPGYTLILAAIFKVFGMGIPGEIAKRCVASVVSAALWGLMPAVSLSLLGSTAPGVLAGLIAAIYPARPLVEIEGDWETPYTALALVLIVVLTYLLWKRGRVTLRNGLWHGFLWGLSLLFVPALLDVFVVFVLAGFYFCKNAGLARYLQFVAAEAAMAALCLAPWVIRNDLAFGKPIVTRTNLGIELRVSNNDEASPDQRVNTLTRVFDHYHPLLSKPDAERVRAMGEVRYNEWASDEAKKWIRSHPARFLTLCIGRARCYWFYFDPTSYGKTVLLAITSLLGFIGFFYVARRHSGAAIVIGLILVLYPLPNYLVHVGLRQEYPLHWLMTLLASVCVLRWIGTAESAGRTKPEHMAARHA